MNERRNKNYECYNMYQHGAKFVRDCETKERIGCYGLGDADGRFEALCGQIRADGGTLFCKDSKKYLIE